MTGITRLPKVHPSRSPLDRLAPEPWTDITRTRGPTSAEYADHIIPESLAGTPEFESVKAKLSLPADFDILGYGNLLPSRPGANLQKGSIVLDPAPTHFFLISNDPQPI